MIIIKSGNIGINRNYILNDAGKISKPNATILIKTQISTKHLQSNILHTRIINILSHTTDNKDDRMVKIKK